MVSRAGIAGRPPANGSPAAPLGRARPIASSAIALELRHLRHFVAVADALSFSDAAKSLTVTQSALTKTVQQLEKELGVCLLQRNRHSVQLTGPGKVFKQRAKRILASVDSAIAATRDAGGQRAK